MRKILIILIIVLFVNNLFAITKIKLDNRSDYKISILLKSENFNRIYKIKSNKKKSIRIHPKIVSDSVSFTFLYSDTLKYIDISTEKFIYNKISTLQIGVIDKFLTKRELFDVDMQSEMDERKDFSFIILQNPNVVSRLDLKSNNDSVIYFLFQFLSDGTIASSYEKLK